MKKIVIVLAALLLVILVACDQQRNSQNYKSKEMSLQEIEVKKPTSSTQDMSLNRTILEQKQQTLTQHFTEPVIAKDKEVDKADDFNTEDYDNIVENKFLAAAQNPLSTFSIDVDKAAAGMKS